MGSLALRLLFTSFCVDRIVRHMIQALEVSGKLLPGGLIVENSSGNTAAAVAMICAERGYRCVLIVPSKCSAEKQAALRAFGAKVLVTPPGTNGRACNLRHISLSALPNSASRSGCAGVWPHSSLCGSCGVVGTKPSSPNHYEQVAMRLERDIPGAVRLDQYNNPLNCNAHFKSTGPELFEQMDGNVDVFVAGAR
jgi:cystathionine beta-synthase